jgi:hypothetical protein
MTDAPPSTGPNAPNPFPDKPYVPPWTYGDGTTRSNPNALPSWPPYPVADWTR